MQTLSFCVCVSTIPNTTGLWKHKHKKITFALYVDDFGVKYYSKQDVQHLITTLQKDYIISIDWVGKHYCGLTYDWQYNKSYVDVSMPNYIEKLLNKFNHAAPKIKQYAPHVWPQKLYGQSTQLATQEDTSEKLHGKQILDVRSKVGTFLYYA